MKIIKCQDCKFQEKQFVTDFCRYEGGYWVYKCKKNECQTMPMAVNGHDGEFCSSAEAK